ncbi:MAG: hypothetical protein GTN80_03685 [Nitrososphaeria archaeon]|nr:hypothetical protein [Nitrososphaeria archaeon]NIQ32733.1 hypothetical protein [Nitrososphaeria archaeon]
MDQKEFETVIENVRSAYSVLKEDMMKFPSFPLTSLQILRAVLEKYIDGKGRVNVEIGR